MKNFDVKKAGISNQQSRFKKPKTVTRFERKKYIKDLFLPESFLTNFDELNFENFSSFKNMIANDFIKFGFNKEITIFIDNENDFNEFLQLAGATDILSEDFFTIKTSRGFASIVLKEFIEKSIRCSIQIPFVFDNDFYENLSLITKGAAWNEKNAVEICVVIDYENYKKQLSYMLEILQKYSFRIFNVKVDYNSFEDMKFSEYHDLYFRWKDLEPWTKRGGETKNSLSFKQTGGIYKPIFISENGFISLTEQSHKDGKFMFDLLSNRDKDGQTINQLELNVIRQYVDMQRVYPTNIAVQNSYLIDYYQNYLVTEAIDELPLISRMFLGDE
ncbi:MAG: hypothetical protein ACLFVR_16095 [Thiohalospira sp.]